MSVIVNKDILDRLVQSSLAGDQKAYRELLGIFRVQIEKDIRFRVSGHEDQEDLIQMTLLKIHKYFTTYSGSGPILAWVRQITKNVVFDFYKYSAKKKYISEGDEWDEDKTEDFYTNTPEDLLQFRESLSSLPTNEANLLNSYVVDGHSIDNLAQSNNVSKSTMKVRIHRAKKLLLEYLGQNET